MAAEARERKDIEKLSDLELKNLRTAFERFQQDTTDWYRLCGYHGLPSHYCHHDGDPIWLAWHRKYLLELENQLRTYIPSVTLPYWDWGSSQAATIGIPRIYNEDINGGNSLKDAPLPDNFRRLGYGTKVSRDWVDPDYSNRSEGLQIFKDQIIPSMHTAQNAHSWDDYWNFSLAPHNAIHVWVGRTMSLIASSAFDPIFWAHHANVDRLWALWQQQHSDVSLPPDEAGQTLVPWDSKVIDVQDTSKLGNVSITYGATANPIEGSAMAFLLREPKKKKYFLRFKGIPSSIDSYALQAFIVDDPSEEIDGTSFSKTPSKFLGRFTVFGNGHCCLEPKCSLELPNISKSDMVIDVTSKMEEVLKKNTLNKIIHLKYVARNITKITNVSLKLSRVLIEEILQGDLKHQAHLFKAPAKATLAVAASQQWTWWYGIKQLFDPTSILHMKTMAPLVLKLDTYGGADGVYQHRNQIYNAVSSGAMPKFAFPWPDEWTNRFHQWIQSGAPEGSPSEEPKYKDLEITISSDPNANTVLRPLVSLEETSDHVKVGTVLQRTLKGDQGKLTWGAKIHGKAVVSTEEWFSPDVPGTESGFNAEGSYTFKWIAVKKGKATIFLSYGAVENNQLQRLQDIQIINVLVS